MSKNKKKKNPDKKPNKYEEFSKVKKIEKDKTKIFR